MSQISIAVAGAHIAYNYLYDNMPMEWRDEDLFFAKLPNGHVIDVGWYPACEPNGWFKITLSDGEQNEIDSKRVVELDRLAGLIERMAAKSRDEILRTTSSVAESGRSLYSSPTNGSSCKVTVVDGDTYPVFRQAIAG
jgi:hypothetical protein